jgi:uncharacterized protein (UPF0332 family)
LQESFNPLDFHHFATFLAQQLSRIPSDLEQAAIRTSVSRAYYASFLLIRDFILLRYEKTLPQDLKRVIRTNKAHRVVARILELTDPVHAQYFINLRKLRNRADYETKESLMHKDLAKALKLAEAIVSNANSIVSRINLGILSEALQDPENEHNRGYRGPNL